MNYDDVAQRIANSHELIQTPPLDRLDCINKTKEIRTVIMSCVAYLDQLYSHPNSWEYTEDDLSFIHESVCVSAIPLLDMVERFLKLAESEAEEHTFAV